MFYAFLGSLIELSNLVARGSYVEALKTPSCQNAIGFSGKRIQKLSQHLRTSFEDYLKSSNDSEESQHTLLCCAICALQLFVQNNFTGPLVGPFFFEAFPCLAGEEEIEICPIKDSINELSVDTEGIYGLVNHPEYLLLAKTVFINLRSQLPACRTISWWSIRFNFVLQKVADELSSTIYDRIVADAKFIEENAIVSPEDRQLISLYYLESGQAFLLFSDIMNASQRFNRARTFLRMKSSLTGALGKRTKFQSIAKAQLIVKVEYEDASIPAEEITGPPLLPEDLPKNVLLDDETRLNTWKFIEEDDDTVPNLTPLEQAGVLLTDVQFKRKSKALEIQDTDETKAYLHALLQYPKCWAVQNCALRLRSKLESTESRAITRARDQFQELVDCVNREEPSRFERLKLFYVCNVRGIWRAKEDFGDILFSIGDTKASLNLFEEMHLWEKVIDCYNRLEMRNRAAVIINNLISTVGETPKFLCLLGDATDDISCYERAWILSNEKSSRAQRSLGDRYFYRKEYETAVIHYKKSLAVSHIQLTVWNKLAYSAMQLQDLQEAVRAYKKCSVLEPDQFEYWNNLGSCYTKLGESEKAYRAFKDAARCKSDSWKVFENLITSSLSVGNYRDALYAYKRILDIKEKHVNPILLERLADGFLRDKTDSEEDVHLHQQLLAFFSGLCQKVPSEFILWYQWGELLATKPDQTVESKDLACQRFKKCLSVLTMGDKWIKDHHQIMRVIMVLLRVEQALQECVTNVPPEAALNHVRSVTFTFERVMRQARKGFTNVMGEVVPAGEKPLRDGDDACLRVKNLINTLEEKKKQSQS